MSAAEVVRRNGAALCPPLPAEPATLVDALYLVDGQGRIETVPEHRQRWERCGSRLLNLLITAPGSIDRLELTAAEDGGDVVVGVCFPGTEKGRSLRVRLESLDQDAKTAVQLALIRRGLATPVRVAAASPARP